MEIVHTGTHVTVNLDPLDTKFTVFRGEDRRELMKASARVMLDMRALFRRKYRLFGPRLKFPNPVLEGSLGPYAEPRHIGFRSQDHDIEVQTGERSLKIVARHEGKTSTCLVTVEDSGFSVHWDGERVSWVFL